MLKACYQHEWIEAGCDEAGRGPLAGPVTAAAVILPPGWNHPLLNDSKKMSEKKQIVTMQVLIVFFIVVSVVIALDPPTFIAQLMGISWGALAGAFLAPFLYWKGVTRAGVWAGFITGVGLTVANMFFGFIKSPINAGAMAMIAGLLIVPFISLITPKLKKSEIEDVFICYDEKVTITKKHSLED